MCGSENIETVKRPDSLKCMYPNEEIVDRCADCGDITSRSIKDVLEVFLKHIDDGGEDGEDA
jgi:hypothetical protein